MSLEIGDRIGELDKVFHTIQFCPELERSGLNLSLEFF